MVTRKSELSGPQRAIVKQTVYCIEGSLLALLMGILHVHVSYWHRFVVGYVLSSVLYVLMRMAISDEVDKRLRDGRDGID